MLRIIVAAVFALYGPCLGTAGGVAQVGPESRINKVTSEFRITDDTANTQASPSIAALTNGGFVVVFTSIDNLTSKILAQRFDQSGQRVGNVILVESVTSDDYYEYSVSSPVVTARRGGNFVIGWQKAFTDLFFGDFYDEIVAQRYSSLGEPAGQLIPVDGIYAVGPAVASLSDGGFVFTWYDYSVSDVFGQKYAADGKRVGQQFLVNTYTENGQFPGAVAGLPNRQFVIVWDSVGQDGSGGGVYGKRYNDTTSGSEFRVNASKKGSQNQPVVAGLQNGGFVVTWTSPQDGSKTGVYAQRFTAAGTRAGTEFRVNSTTLGVQSGPAVTGLDNGGFVITWTSPDGASTGIFGQRYNSTGTPVGGQFRVNKTAARAQEKSSIAALKDGGFVVVWSSGEEDETPGIYGRRFEP
jgi:hypothetical protein